MFTSVKNSWPYNSEVIILTVVYFLLGYKLFSTGVIIIFYWSKNYFLLGYKLFSTGVKIIFYWGKNYFLLGTNYFYRS